MNLVCSTDSSNIVKCKQLNFQTTYGKVIIHLVACAFHSRRTPSFQGVMLAQLLHTFILKLMVRTYVYVNEKRMRYWACYADVWRTTADPDNLANNRLRMFS